MKRAKTISFTAKCSDLFDLVIADGDEVVAEHDGYVPSGLGIGGGDYVELTINLETGFVVGWKSITIDDAIATIPSEDDEDDEDAETLQEKQDRLFNEGSIAKDFTKNRNFVKPVIREVSLVEREAEDIDPTSIAGKIIDLSKQELINYLGFEPIVEDDMPYAWFAKIDGQVCLICGTEKNESINIWQTFGPEAAFRKAFPKNWEK